MKKLFIYYTNTGNCASVAAFLEKRGALQGMMQSDNPDPGAMKRLSEEMDDLQDRLQMVDDVVAFFFKIMSGGFAAMRGKCAPLDDYDGDVSAYDAVVIGSPVWNGRLSAPINTVLKDTDLSGKQLAFVLCAGSGEGPKALERINAEYPGARVIALKEPNKYPEELEKLAGLFPDETTI